LPRELLGQVLTALKAEKERRRKSETARFTKWRADPVGFVNTVLLGFLWSKQRQICESVLRNRRTAVPSCHDVGKSAIAGRVCAWWLSVHEPGEAFVVTLAPTYHQVRGILWREINRVHGAGGLPGHTNQTEWWIGGELVGFGRSPKDTDPTAIQGIHAPKVLVVVDEGCGVGKELIDAADTLIANEDSRILIIGNPDDPNTEFAEVCKPGSGWNVIPISAFDSPNFTGEEVPEFLRPLLISKTWVAEKLKKWGEQSPLYQSKVLGKFPEQSTDSLIPISALNAAKSRELPPGDPNELGVDVARFGGDSTVIINRQGPRAKRVAKDQNRDLMHVVGMVIRSIKETGARAVKIDDIGLGGGVTDRLRELKYSSKPDDAEAKAVLANVEIVPINVGEAPGTNLADERFKNLRAELSWGMRTRFIDGSIALEGDNDDLLSQAAQIKYKYTSSGEIQIEAKADMKKRTKGVSPDDWDALVLAFAKPQFAGAGVFEFYKIEAQKLQDQKAQSSSPAIAAKSGVALRMPAGISNISGLDGRSYLVGIGSLVTVHPDDVNALVAIGAERMLTTPP
jgi:hypothetical protein